MNLIKCEKLEKSMAELQFSIDAEAFKKATADVFKKEGKKYPVQGFRKGKAPRALIEKFYGKDVFTYDAINELFPEAFEAAVKEANVEPVGRPEVTVDSADETNGVTLPQKAQNSRQSSHLPGSKGRGSTPFKREAMVPVSLLRPVNTPRRWKAPRHTFWILARQLPVCV